MVSKEWQYGKSLAGIAVTDYKGMAVAVIMKVLTFNSLLLLYLVLVLYFPPKGEVPHYVVQCLEGGMGGGGGGGGGGGI